MQEGDPRHEHRGWPHKEWGGVRYLGYSARQLGEARKLDEQARASLAAEDPAQKGSILPPGVPEPKVTQAQIAEARRARQEPL